MISNSGHDEKGKYTGGTAGDQTGTEWQIRSWYNRPWQCVLRHPNAVVGKTISDLSIKAAKNNNIGYDQAQRNTYWTQLKAVGYDPSKISVKCEADCSAGVIANVKAAGHLLKIASLQNLNATYTGNLRAGAKAAGFQVLTASKYLTSEKYLQLGDILLNDAHHVAVYVGNGSLTTSGTSGSASKPSESATSKLAIDGQGGVLTIKKAQSVFGTYVDGIISNQKTACKKYMRGFVSSCVDWDGGAGGSSLVKAIQKWAGATQDGYWGINTSKAVQRKLGVTADGYFGLNSMKAFQKWLNTK